MSITNSHESFGTKLFNAAGVLVLFAVLLGGFVALLLVSSWLDWPLRIVCVFPIVAFSKWLFGDNVMELAAVSIVLITLLFLLTPAARGFQKQMKRSHGKKQTSLLRQPEFELLISMDSK